MINKSLLGLSVLSLVLLSVGSASALQLGISLSPASGDALNLGSDIWGGDHALGAAAPNESTQPASPATGDVIGSGITYDTVTNELSFDMGYGSDFGFVDLNGNVSVFHFHGSAGQTVNFPAVNSNAGVIVDLAPFHTAGSSTMTGSFTGTTTLSETQESWLLDHQIYLNVHSSFAGGGEIRGQLVPTSLIPEPASMGLALVGGLALLGRRRS